MSQKLNKNSLISTDPLSNYENEHVLFNFSYCLENKKIDNSVYAKVLKEILKSSKYLIKDFVKKIKIEYNENIIKRQCKKNTKFILEIYNNNSHNFKSTRDIVRKDSLRAYGNLIKNIFYILEIDPSHDSR